MCKTDIIQLKIAWKICQIGSKNVPNNVENLLFQKAFFFSYTFMESGSSRCKTEWVKNSIFFLTHSKNLITISSAQVTVCCLHNLMLEFLLVVIFAFMFLHTFSPLFLLLCRTFISVLKLCCSLPVKVGIFFIATNMTTISLKWKGSVKPITTNKYCLTIHKHSVGSV